MFWFNYCSTLFGTLCCHVLVDGGCGVSAGPVWSKDSPVLSLSFLFTTTTLIEEPVESREVEAAQWGPREICGGRIGRKETGLVDLQLLS